MRKLFITTAMMATAMGGAAVAETMAHAGTDLNVRSGPGAQYEVAGVIKSGDEVKVEGCLKEANWCKVAYDGKDGWAYGDYLVTKIGEKTEPLYPNREAAKVTVVEAPAVPAGKQAADGATGAAAGALVAGPVGAVVGAAVGGTAASIQPAPEVKTYITQNPHDPVILDGEVMVGAGVPEAVTLYDIPEQKDYKYVVINGQPVLVNPADRKIVYIYR